MSKQSMSGDKTGWKRGAGEYSRSYPKLDRYEPRNAAESLDAKLDATGYRNDGYSAEVSRSKRGR